MRKSKLLLITLMAASLMYVSCSGVAAVLFSILIGSSICGVQVSVDGQYRGETQIDPTFEAIHGLLCSLIIGLFSEGEHTITAALPSGAVLTSSGEEIPVEARSASYSAYLTEGYSATMYLDLPQSVTLAQASSAGSRQVRLFLQAVDPEQENPSKPVESDPIRVIERNTATPVPSVPSAFPTATSVPVIVIPTIMATPYLTPTRIPTQAPTAPPILELKPYECPQDTSSVPNRSGSVLVSYTYPEKTELEVEQRVPGHAFIGSVTIRGVPAPDGIVIQAFSQANLEEPLACAEVRNGRYLLNVPPLPAGEYIIFKVEGMLVPDPVLWEQGKITEFNLDR